MLNPEQQQRLARAFPGLSSQPTDTWEVLSDSDNALCVQASGDVSGPVWRVPKTAEIASRTQTELALLEYLAERKLGAIHTPVVLQRSAVNAAHCLSYLPGTVLSRELLAENRNPAQLLAIRKSVCALLAELGTVVLPEHILTELPHCDPYDGPRALRKLDLPRVFPQYSETIHEALHWAEAADRASFIGLLHNDVAPGNLILGEAEQVTGVIDWTNAYIGPRYRELRQLMLMAPYVVEPLLASMRTVTRVGVAATAFLRGIRLLNDEPRHELCIFEVERARDLFNKHKQFTC